MQTVSIIIPNFNGRELLKENLPQIIKLKKANKEVVEVILVDDGSVDDSITFVRNNFPEVKVIEKKSNSGFIDSVNLGVTKAKGTLVFLLNTDVTVQTNIIPRLVKYFSEDRVFAVGCLDKSIERNSIVERGRGIGKFYRGFLIHKRGDIHQTNTLWVSGGSGIFNKEIWQKLGGLSTVFRPFYWEDIDISYRALKSGYKIYFAKDAVVKHEHQKGAIYKKYNKKQIKKISLRNQILFVWKNISDGNLLFEHLVYLLYYILLSLIKADLTFINAFFSALIRLPEVREKRAREKKLWIKSDAEVLREFSYE